MILTTNINLISSNVFSNNIGIKEKNTYYTICFIMKKGDEIKRLYIKSKYLVYFINFCRFRPVTSNMKLPDEYYDFIDESNELARSSSTEYTFHTHNIKHDLFNLINDFYKHTNIRVPIEKFISNPGIYCSFMHKLWSIDDFRNCFIENEIPFTDEEDIKLSIDYFCEDGSDHVVYNVINSEEQENDLINKKNSHMKPNKNKKRGRNRIYRDEQAYKEANKILKRKRLRRGRPRKNDPIITKAQKKFLIERYKINKTICDISIVHEDDTIIIKYFINQKIFKTYSKVKIENQ